MTEPTAKHDKPQLMGDDDFEALEEVLTSDVVPEDCMDLEMLDGFLAGVLISPRPIAAERWLPDVWSAHGEEASFGGGSGLQRAIRLVKAYYNEMATTLVSMTTTAKTVAMVTMKMGRCAGSRSALPLVMAIASRLAKSGSTASPRVSICGPRAGKKAWMRMRWWR